MVNEDALAVCPYYQNTHGCSIVCETIVDDERCKDSLVFLNSKYRANYQEKFCRSIKNYKNCKRAEAIERKYSK